MVGLMGRWHGDAGGGPCRCLRVLDANGGRDAQSDKHHKFDTRTTPPRFVQSVHRTLESVVYNEGVRSRSDLLPGTKPVFDTPALPMPDKHQPLYPGSWAVSRPWRRTRRSCEPASMSTVGVDRLPNKSTMRPSIKSRGIVPGGPNPWSPTCLEQ
ncbi:hypothetical protein BT67DRAFT_93647 [Trichocladium antarcticum]|uniref:Uncharacterized protein n=1 Tax=Trichocladium antarcticum TaxID=1450529 RepID=A0AAN6ZBJ5_9PEZI|nr:hypothetical protein BT67DRAFT_93647 [Trichocladium antarcticum]